MSGYNKKFIFEGKDLFMETKYKYFFAVIFPMSWRESWTVGKIFLRKYPTAFDLDKKLISIYNEKNKNYNQDGNDNENDNGNMKKDEGQNNITLSTKYIIIIILIIILLICIFSIIFYFIGKNLNKFRKRKANELSDDYDYSSIEDNNTINSFPY